ncbi:hypothetical protein IE53DRAFT_400060 [Violaceomyces palustris]|uniref:Uncharacterized protein n=1 Tax=Violaceomyces palustris TaxID=1673888 RepID=A0ACD0NRC0_9BASI|nr:hypothetical protein IE53DRAFT_400060 [Violaceomyces palustris]
MKLFSGSHLATLGALGLFGFSSLVFSAHSETDLSKRQAPNTVYPGHESEMTGSYNQTIWVLPIDKSVAKSMAGGNYELLEHGLDSSYIGPNQHPLLIVAGYMYDIRQGITKVNQLSSTSVYVPFVDRTGQGKPFLCSTLTLLDQLVPTLVGFLSQITVTGLANYDPPHNAYKNTGINDFSLTITQGTTILTPNLAVTKFQSNFHATPQQSIKSEQFISMVNQPFYKPLTGLCNYQTQLYNETFSSPFFVTGQVQTFNPVTPSTMVFNDAQGWTATAEWISGSGLGQSCSNFV